MGSGLVCSRGNHTHTHTQGRNFTWNRNARPICLERPTVPFCYRRFLMFNSKFGRWSRSRYALTIPVWLSLCSSPSSSSSVCHVVLSVPCVFSCSWIFLLPRVAVQRQRSLSDFDLLLYLLNQNYLLMNISLLSIQIFVFAKAGKRTASKVRKISA